MFLNNLLQYTSSHIIADFVCIVTVYALFAKYSLHFLCQLFQKFLIVMQNLQSVKNRTSKRPLLLHEFMFQKVFHHQLIVKAHTVGFWCSFSSFLSSFAHHNGQPPALVQCKMCSSLNGYQAPKVIQQTPMSSFITEINIFNAWYKKPDVVSIVIFHIHDNCSLFSVRLAHLWMNWKFRQSQMLPR